MSIRGIRRASGKLVWEVRWRDGGANRARNFDRKRDAERFDAETRRRRQMGELASLTEGNVTLAEFGIEWGRKYARRRQYGMARAT